MRIGGFVKQSSDEWPGENVAIVYVKGCNFRCSYCRNTLMALPGLLDRTTEIPQDIVFHYLKMSHPKLTGVVVSGGEPTMQQSLPGFLASVKALGLKVKLTTNGTNPEMLNKLINLKLVDHISMDIKSGFAPGQYESITGTRSDIYIESVLQSISILKSSGISHQFFTTVLPGIHTPEILGELGALLAGSEHIINKFKAEKSSEVVSGK